MQTQDNPRPRKLRILCLHGYNNTGEIMKFQMKNFIETFGDLCEFTFLDGPAISQWPVIQHFVDRGIPAPYYGMIEPKPGY